MLTTLQRKLLKEWFSLFSKKCNRRICELFSDSAIGLFISSLPTRIICFQKSIPVYSCRKASYVACDVISAIPTTTELPATRKIRKKTSTVESETVENAETTSSKPQGSSYLHSEFLGNLDFLIKKKQRFQMSI